MNNSTSAPFRTGSPHRAWAGLGLLLLPTAMVAIDINILFLALPAITVDLGASALNQLWIADVYTLLVGALVIVAGALGDRIGRRRLLMWGCAGFLVASLLAAYAPSPAWLIAARAMQGLTGATLMPSTLALIGELFSDATRRTRAISLWATCQFGCAALGPVVGGVVLDRLWWGSVFLIAVAPCLAVVLLGRRLLPERVGVADTPPVDPASVVLLIGTVTPLHLACKTMLPSVAASAGTQVGLTAVGVVLGVVFIRRQLVIEAPLLDLGLLVRPVIATTVAALVLAGICLAGLGLWVTQYLQSGLGLTPLAAAAAFAPMGLGIAASTMLAPTLTRWVTPTTAVPLGLVVAASGGALLTTAHSAWVVITAVTITAAGCGPLFAFGTTRVVMTAPANRAGRAAGLSETCNYLGSALGIAILGTLGAWLYARDLENDLTALPAERAAAASESLAAGRSVALDLPDPDLVGAVTDAGAAALHGFGLLVPGLFLVAAVATSLGARSARGNLTGHHT